MAESPLVIVHIDGASRGNPGPAAYGVIVESSDGTKLAEFSECLGETTNNFAEYQALLAALEYALNHDYLRVHVLTDSELLALQIEGIYKVKSPGLRPLHGRAQQMIARLESFSIRHVPREQNAEADRLANQALDANDQTRPTREIAGSGFGLAASEPQQAGASPGPANHAPPRSEVASPLRAPATFRKGLLEPHQQLPLFEGEVVDLEIYRKRRFNG